MIKINVITNNVRWFTYIKNPNYYLDRKINKINLKDRNYNKKILFCTLLLSGNKEIKYLNKKFRKKNKTTDVLSFPFHNKNELKIKLKEDKEIYLGDIIININKIGEKNKIENFKNKFDYLWIHGFVHLFGFDHKKDKDYLEMKRVEEKYFNFINDR
jgi:probable rRNA maturation factor